MSPLPERVDTNASLDPSGEKNGRRSVAGFETMSRASPPDVATVHRSPPDAKTISRWSGEKLGSEKDGTDAGSSTAVVTGLTNAALASARMTRDSGSDMIFESGEENGEMETL